MVENFKRITLIWTKITQIYPQIQFSITFPCKSAPFSDVTTTTGRLGRSAAAMDSLAVIRTTGIDERRLWSLGGAAAAAAMSFVVVFSFCADDVKKQRRVESTDSATIFRWSLHNVTECDSLAMANMGPRAVSYRAWYVCLNIAGVLGATRFFYVGTAKKVYCEKIGSASKDPILNFNILPNSKTTVLIIEIAV